MRGSQRSLRVVVAAMIVALVAPVIVQAAPILYPDSPVVPPGVQFTNIFESSATDPVPLYGAPSYFTTGADFDPAAFASFSSTSSGGGSDVTDGQLNFTISGAVTQTGMVGIDSLTLFEAGDYTLAGTGTSATQVLAGAILRVTVTEIDGVPVAPIALTPVNASVGFNLAANPGVVQPWSLGLSMNVQGQIGTGHTVGATKVEVAINNQLLAISQPSTLAFMAKKDFRVTLGTDVSGVIPEPATVSLLALAACGTLMRRRRGA